MDYASGTSRSSSSSQASAWLSLGARQSLRGESEPPEPTFGAFGSVDRLNWLEEPSQEHGQPVLDSWDDGFENGGCFVAGRCEVAAEPALAIASAQDRHHESGDPPSAIGQAILINRVPFTVIGVAPPEFFGVDPASAPHVYLPMRTSLLLQPDGGRAYLDQNYYWVEIMGRLKPGVDRARAQARGRSRSGSPRRRPTIESAPIFQRCDSQRARRDSSA